MATTVFLLGLTLAMLVSISESSPYPSTTLKTLTLEEVVPLGPDFFPDIIAASWISDTEYTYRDPSGSLKKYNALTNTDVTLLNLDELHNISGHAVASFSKDGKFLLLSANKKKVYRHSSTADYSVFDLDTKEMVNLTEGPLQVVIWSNGRSLAYVKDNNVFYVPDATHPTNFTALTTEGVPGEVYFGATDWIYEEEVFSAAEAMWFSPNDVYLAVASFNDTDVESAVFPYYGKPTGMDDQYPQMVEFKYPKAGRKNPDVALQVFKLNEPQSEPWNIPAPVDVVGSDHILGRVNWASNENLVVLWLNRRQNISVLVNCDLQQDKCNMMKEHVEPDGWIDIEEPFFDDSGTRIVDIQPLYHKDQRFAHAARFDFTSMTTEDLSPGNLTVRKILGWNQEKDTIYYIVSPGAQPWQRQLWATSGGFIRCVSCKEPSCHHVSAVFSQGASYAIISCSASNIPPKSFLYSVKDDSFKEFTNNSKLIEKLSQYKWPLTMFSSIRLEQNVTANVELLLPPEMRQGKKYPMIVKVYGGPGSSLVDDKFDFSEFYHTYLAANRSFIIANIDVRGSAVMGTDALHAVNLALGTVEITDTLAAIRRLLEMYPFIDSKRVGVWGWSYGGFVTTMMLIKDDKHTIACGAAVAPVTSWLYYDTIYTERFMSTPQDNPEGYKQSDVIAAAERLRGRKYLLVHGSADDNVHYQHSMQLAKQLQHADIPFEQMSYTDENHSLLGVSRHFYHTLDHFWTECFYS